MIKKTHYLSNARASKALAEFYHLQSQYSFANLPNGEKKREPQIFVPLTIETATKENPIKLAILRMRQY